MWYGKVYTILLRLAFSYKQLAFVELFTLILGPILWFLYFIFPEPFKTELLSFKIVIAWIVFLLFYLLKGYFLKTSFWMFIRRIFRTYFGWVAIIIGLTVLISFSSIPDKQEVTFPHRSFLGLLLSKNGSANEFGRNINGEFEIPLIITSENSELPSNNIRSIYIDSSNTAWIGTDAGLSRLNSDGWMHYSKGNFMISNLVNDIDYELTSYGKELWVATDSGLTVAAYSDLDGITSATTYVSANSDMVGDKVKCVLVDPHHNRWVATDSAINVFRESDWSSVLEAYDADDAEFKFTEYDVTDMACYESIENILITTSGKGVLRMSYNEVDGITGASTYGYPWAKNSSDNIFSVSILGDTQWYGNDLGADKHTGPLTKEGWEAFGTEDGLLDGAVQATFIDKDTNIWFGTESGLSILTPTGWYKYTPEEGLINTVINTMNEDYNGYVWVGTNGGIQRFQDVPGVRIENSSTENLVADINNLRIKVFPNPAIDLIYIETESKSAILENQIQIYNLSGKKVYEKTENLNEEPVRINLEENGIVNGVWVLKVIQGAKRSSKVFIVRN